MNFQEAVTKHINKLVGELKEEKELKEALKRKLTKKEYKVFLHKEEGQSLKEIATSINEDLERVTKLYENVCWKLNQEKIKNELIKH